MQSPVRILMVEDNRLDTLLISETLRGLESWPVELTTVEDGGTAMDYLTGRMGLTTAVFPNLLLLDLNLPKHDGLEILRYVRKEPRYEQLQVFVFSSSPVEIVRAQVETAGLRADRYYTKPCELDEFESLGHDIRRSYLAGSCTL